MGMMQRIEDRVLVSEVMREEAPKVRFINLWRVQRHGAESRCQELLVPKGSQQSDCRRWEHPTVPPEAMHPTAPGVELARPTPRAVWRL